MKRVFLIFMIIVVAVSVSAQEPIQGELIAKLKQHQRHIMSNQNNIFLTDWASVYPEIEFERKFPEKKAVIEQYSREGFPLVDLSLIYSVRFDENRNAAAVQNLLLQSGIFEYVELVYPQQLLSTTYHVPTDPSLNEQYYLDNINAYRAWGVHRGDSNTIVGISDTGTDIDHPDLMDNIAYNFNDPLDGVDNDNDGYVDNYRGWDLGEWDNNPDVNTIAHGSHVSGIVAATPDNNEGVTGVGYNISYLPLKVDDQYGKLTMGYESIVYAADHGCDVVNCSWGGNAGAGQYGQDVINYATYNKDVLVVAACGNSNNMVENFPAAYENVISVAATDRKDYKWKGSTFNYSVDLCAPGHRIYNTYVNGNYVRYNGTSMASPMVAAAAGLLRSKYPGLTALQTGEQLRMNTRNIYDDVITRQYRNKLGTGILDMYKALVDQSKSSVRFSDIQWSREGAAGTIYDTLLISGKFTSFLATTPLNSKVILRCSHPSVVVLDSVISIGALTAGSQVDNLAHPFKIMVLPNMPVSEKIHFKLVYDYGSQMDYQYFHEVFNRGYLTFNTGNFKITLNSSGKAAYNDPFYKQGIGLIHENLNESMLSTAGLMVATSASRVSDKVYGEYGFDHDFEASALLQKVDSLNKPYYDRQYTSEFDDAAMGSLSTGLAVTQNVLDWNTAEDEDYIILEYVVRNPGNTTVNNVYVGYYMDWNINHSHKNRCEWNSTKNMSWVYDTEGYGVGAMRLLKSAGPVNHYAFDNDGDDGSIKISDGFAGYEKWQAMQDNRHQAGFSLSIGNNVSHLISSGPYTLNPGDSVVLAWAIMAGNNQYDVIQAADRAFDQYFNASSVSELQHENNLMVYPNPAKQTFNIELPESQLWQYEILDAQGKRFDKGSFFGKSFSYLSELETGVYFLKVFSEDNSYQTKIILQ